MSDVVNNRAHHRFELIVDGHLAAAYYKLDGDVISLPKCRRNSAATASDQSC
jgi:hypothetical protein